MIQLISSWFSLDALRMGARTDGVDSGDLWRVQLGMVYSLFD